MCLEKITNMYTHFTMQVFDAAIAVNVSGLINPQNYRRFNKIYLLYVC